MKEDIFLVNKNLPKKGTRGKVIREGFKWAKLGPLMEPIRTLFFPVNQFVL